ncbi:MAG: pyridoxamine 5'-phosphate oxidase [Actinomycetia bacterium]|nr:pyridoxamine 5'-phosphate oxidase [Actinomycetes bacterium]
MVAEDRGASSSATLRARVQYETEGLRESEIADTPLAQLSRWLQQAASAGVAEPNAMSFATCGPDGPQVRIVLAKDLLGSGITFFTNLESAKARDLDESPRAAAVFAWLPLHRQVRFRGPVVELSRAESGAYFATRPRGSQIGAWASPQSHPIATREELLAQVAEIERRFPEESEIPLPDHWGGYRILPIAMEFWQGQPSRLHDRLRFDACVDDAQLDDPSGWTLTRLAP